VRWLATLALMVLPALAANAQEQVPISALLENPHEYDQTVVTVVGEIVGDYGDRGTHFWVQVNDDPYVEQPSATGRLAGANTGISVRYAAEFHGEFGPPGGYGIRGPIVQVIGIFRNLDPGSGGITFVEATALTLLQPAQRLPERGPSVPSLTVGVLLTVGGLAAMAQRRDLLPGFNR
jgi:hypothetical protein